MAQSSQQLPGPFLRGDASRLVALGFALTGVIVLLLGTSLLILVRDFVLRQELGIFAYIIVGVPLTLTTIVAVAAGQIAIAYGLWAHDTDAWYGAVALSTTLVLVGGTVAATGGGVTWTVPVIGAVALLALWFDRSLFDLDGGLRALKR